jgi:MscS family membrane protein
VDAWYEALPDRRLRDAFVRTGLDVMVRPGPLELLWWQWFALAALLLAATIVGRLFGRLTCTALQQIARRTRVPWGDELISSLAGPLALGWGLAAVWAGSQYLLLVKPAYRLIDGIATAGITFAVFLALWRGTGAGLRILLGRPWARDNASAHTLVAVSANFARGALIVAGALAIMATLGYPIGTLLAGLGIGGLGLAFGAQKTIENLFGSVSIAIDQPFRVGDSVSVAGVTGVVESIGLRSTRLRTADRTLVAIPNGKLADERTECHATRDRYRLTSKIGLRCDTTREQLQAVLAGILAVLREHPRIWSDGTTVNFAAIGESSLDIEVLAWFDVSTAAEFVSCREDVLLGIMRVVGDAGTAFAIPTRTIHLRGTSAG